MQAIVLGEMFLRSTRSTLKRSASKIMIWVEISSPVGTIVTEVKLWEGVGPGTVAKPTDNAWAYGQIAAKEYGKTPRGGNNNEILVDDYDRLSGTSCRNGGYTRVSTRKFLATINPGERNEIWNDH